MERTAVEEHFVAFGPLFGREFEDGRRGQLAQVEVAELRSIAFAQQLDRSARVGRFAGRAGILQDDVFGYGAAVDLDGHAVVHDLDVERVPLAVGVVGIDRGG